MWGCLLGGYSRQTGRRRGWLKSHGCKGQSQQTGVLQPARCFGRKSYGICWVSERFSTEGSITWVEKRGQVQRESHAQQGFEACPGISHFEVLKKRQNGILRSGRKSCSFKKLRDVIAQLLNGNKAAPAFSVFTFPAT